MYPIILLQNITTDDLSRVGGKAYSLAMMARNEFNIADTLCVTTDAYETYIRSAGLRERILLELNRKDASDMRWEEVWDSALRIRNMFLNTPIPPELYQSLYVPVKAHFSGKAVVVRSSAPGEDSAKASFAGLHESFVNITGVEAILEHIKLVWASLWSDAAMLYRQELGLDVETSTMAVVIQEIVCGECSGVAFSQSPTENAQAVIESVYGLNQGLVDGTVEPDRWMVDRQSSRIVSHTPAQRDHYMIPGSQGIRMVPVPAELAERPPLQEEEVLQVFDLALLAEQFYSSPQDVEWTFRERELYTLQARPITTISKPDPTDDRRQWDLSLRRSYENLKILGHKIDKEYIPDMIAEADRLAQDELASLSDRELVQEIERRTEIVKTWKDIYWADFIPFAHGIRIFGQVYNDAVRPGDPYQFVQLLQATEMQSLERNRKLSEMATMLRNDHHLFDTLKNHDMEHLDQSFADTFQEFITQFGDLASHSLRNEHTTQEQKMLIQVMLEMAEHPPVTSQQAIADTNALKEEYLNTFADGEQREQALDIMELGRLSYQLRDDDNIYLGKIEDQLTCAVNEGRTRLAGRGMPGHDALNAQDVAKALLDPEYRPQKKGKEETREIPEDFLLKSRQLPGQPAGPGLARASARVILDASDLAAFQYGEILVCDAIDPTMTFIVPLAAGIVERRGGMLIHGAIIAREYGLPCVTGVPNAANVIRTGDQITVDGYLGIVTIGSAHDKWKI